MSENPNSPAEPASPGAQPAGAPQLPPVSMTFLVEQFATQAYLFLGLIPHPATGKTEKNLPIARHAIDMLSLVQEKTKGNLSAEETQLLTAALHQLRMAFIKASAPV